MQIFSDILKKKKKKKKKKNSLSAGAESRKSKRANINVFDDYVLVLCGKAENYILKFIQARPRGHISSATY